MRIDNLLICADDFAQDEAISEGILTLAAESRLNAISCLVNGSSWPSAALRLNQLNNHTAIGLHLNLTTGRPMSPHWRAAYGDRFPSLTHLFCLLSMGKINLALVLSEYIFQWENFVEKIGRLPDFIDGHQHIQQYGILREAVLKLFLKYDFQGFCRVSTNGLSDLYTLYGFPKPAAMWLLGGGCLKRVLKKEKIMTNTTFQGFYSFKRAKNYRHYFRQFLARSQKGGLIMCHPGLSSDEHDPLYHSRSYEYEYMMSSYYWQDLEEFGFGREVK